LVWQGCGTLAVVFRVVHHEVASAQFAASWATMPRTAGSSTCGRDAGVDAVTDDPSNHILMHTISVAGIECGEVFLDV